MSPPPAQRRTFLWALGALSGFVSGLLGVGGGLVTGPVLSAAGVPFQRAIGTAVAVVVPVALVGVVTEILTRPENLVWWAALFLALGGQCGAVLGGRLWNRLPERALRLLYALLLVYAGLRSLGAFGYGAGGVAGGLLAADPAGFDLHTAARWGACAALGVLAGMSSTLFGIGGGVVTVPGLLFLTGGFTPHAATGTSLLAMVPTAARSYRIARRQGRIDVKLVRQLLPLAALAAAAAVILRNVWLAPALLARLFGVFLIVAAAQVAAPALRRKRSAAAARP
ncbi:MAG: anion permease [Planctomycetota bacterium]|nr:MAG: anion permease [Planctomycetota bacterium]